MIRELDTVVLTHDVPEHGLEGGDLGAVVHVYHNDAAYEVEFVTAEGRIVAVLTLLPADIRPMSRQLNQNSRQRNQRASNGTTPAATKVAV